MSAQETLQRAADAGGILVHGWSLLEHGWLVAAIREVLTCIEAALALHQRVHPDRDECLCGATWVDGSCQSPTVKILQGKKP